MASKNLRLRDNWQTDSGKLAKRAEYDLTDLLKAVLPEDKYIVDEQIMDFKHVYSDVQLPKDKLKKIYNPGDDVINSSNWGWVPDNSIENKKTGKKIFIELKMQDGWVEGKPQSAGRGNAHERSLKHFAPGIMKMERKASGIDDKDFLPFLIIFCGDITRDPRRNREIYFWFDKYQDNYFMWKHDNDNTVDLKEFSKYLNEKVLPHLE